MLNAVRIETCNIACQDDGMPKTIQIRDVDDDVYEALARRAADLGLSVPEMLRKESERLAARPTVNEWLDRTRRRSSERTARETLEALDELRGPWPS
jgi:antitoxin FitA